MELGLGNLASLLPPGPDALHGVLGRQALGDLLLDLAARVDPALVLAPVQPLLRRGREPWVTVGHPRCLLSTPSGPGLPVGG